jgi:hypothetical protein
MQTEAPTSAELSTWCADHLGSAPRDVLFEAGHLSTVVGFELEDRRRVVVKARPESDRPLDCFVVQCHLSDSGFPCPRPSIEPMVCGHWLIGAEQYMPEGEQLTAGSDLPRLFARALARLVSAAPPAGRVSRLADPVPWLGWNHQEQALWPVPDDLAVNLNDRPGPAWLDDIAERIRLRMRLDNDPPIVGHGDWESQNLRWTGRGLHCVHDWDSCVSHTEPAIAGAAAAVYTATGGPSTNPSVEQTEEFLTEYQVASGAAWSAEQMEVAWAAGLWVRVYNAKKEIVAGRGHRSADTLLPELSQRLVRIGSV